jgi:hypothetical protein
VNILVSVAVVGAAGVCAVIASYVMWRVTSRSGLWSLVAAGILAIVAFFAAVAIGVLLTNAWFRGLR